LESGRGGVERRSRRRDVVDKKHGTRLGLARVDKRTGHVFLAVQAIEADLRRGFADAAQGSPQERQAGEAGDLDRDQPSLVVAALTAPAGM
jgi:hypothetical protein